MAANFLIKCWVKPVGSEGPLVPRLQRGVGPAVRLLTLEQMGADRDCPKWFRVEDMTFDLQEDGGVDRIETYERLGGALNAGIVRPRAEEKYSRLFVEPGEKSEGNPNSRMTFKRIDDVAHFRFTEGAVEREYLIGPGLTALMGEGRLRGIDVDLRGFMDRKPV